MQLKMQTDYAIRVLLYLAGRREPAVTKEMASALGISEGYLPKVTQRLRRAGWVSSSAGVAGGFQLIEDPGKITLYDVMRVTEDTVRINRCLEGDGYCSRFATDTCPVHEVYEIFQEEVQQYFSSITIRSLLTEDRHSQRKRLLDHLKRLAVARVERETEGGREYGAVYDG